VKYCALSQAGLCHMDMDMSDVDMDICHMNILSYGYGYRYIGYMDMDICRI
jgi:hypothetical protein